MIFWVLEILLIFCKENNENQPKKGFWPLKFLNFYLWWKNHIGWWFIFSKIIIKISGLVGIQNVFNKLEIYNIYRWLCWIIFSVFFVLYIYIYIEKRPVTFCIEKLILPIKLIKHAVRGSFLCKKANFTNKIDKTPGDGFIFV